MSLNQFKQFTLRKLTCSTSLIETFENFAAVEADAIGHAFHRVKVFGWNDTLEKLFDKIVQYFEASLVPINATAKGEHLTYFYTSNLCLILNIMKLDFVLPHARHIFQLEIIFHEKTSTDMFGNSITLDDIVGNVLKQRFNDCELDLSNFCKDPEFIDNKINFYKVSLLANFKLLMIRMANSTKILNLSHNNLSTVPQEILNFFISKDLTAINISYNDIQSFVQLQRVSSKIEKIWIEGNPLCDSVDSRAYIKNLLNKFPMLTEVDGVKLSDYECGITDLERIPPCKRYFTAVPNNATKVITDKFLTLFFSFHDNATLSESHLYDDDALFTMMNDFSEEEEKLLDPYYVYYGRNMLCKRKRNLTLPTNDNSSQICSINKPSLNLELLECLSKMPKTAHDPTTFTVDILLHDSQRLMLVVEGIFKQETGKAKMPVSFFTFRRTFILQVHAVAEGLKYSIKHDMLFMSFARKEQIQNSFKRPLVNFDSLALLDPDEEDIAAVIKAFRNVTKLNQNEAQLRLQNCQWDIREALKQFMLEMQNHRISNDLFIFEENDFSNTSFVFETMD